MEEESLDDLKEYLREVKADDLPCCLNIIVQKPEDIDEINKKAVLQAKEQKGFCIESDSISMAIILGELETAERLIDELPYINMYIGYTTISSLSGSCSMQISLARLLYSENIDVPEGLRFKILKKLNDNLIYGVVSVHGLVDINDIIEIYRPTVQAKIVNDYIKQPEYFDYQDNPRSIYYLPSACFLMKLYKNEPDKLNRLMSERIEILCDDYFAREAESIRIDVRMLTKAYEYEWMKTYRAELYSMLITVYTLIEKACNDSMYFFVFEDEYKKINEIKTEMFEQISGLTINENDFAKSIEMIKKMGMTAVVNSYAFGEALLGHKPKLTISPQFGSSLEAFFGFGEEEDEEGDPYGDFTNNRKRCQLVRLSESIGGIEYQVSEDTDLGLKIARFLSANAKLIKESFLAFAEKGLIPDEYVDYVTKRANFPSNHNCAYMVPILIMQKYGRLKSNG